MGRNIYLTDLTKKEFVLGKASLKILEAEYGLDECVLSAIEPLLKEFKILEEENEKLKKEVEEIKTIMNNNNAFFEKKLQDIVKNFKIKINNDLEEEHDGDDIVKLNLNAYEGND